MSDAELPRLPRIAPPEDVGGVVVPLRPRDRKSLDQRERRRAMREARRTRPPRIMHWRRLWLLMIPIGILAIVSMVFGFVVAVASQLPSLNHFIIAANPQNSLIYDDDGHRVAVMTDDLHRAYYVPPSEIPQLMKRAIVAIEDKRFYTESGVDVKGLARAFFADLTGSGTRQGASTITEQLVKVINKATFHRTLFEKLTEAALAFQLSHKYTKDQVLGAYLNDVYYGNGAYGIEAAAQTYFGHDPTSNLFGCGYSPGDPAKLCVAQLTPAEAALLAGLVNHPPTSWDYSVQGPELRRRNLVLLDMYNQGYIPLHGYGGYLEAKATPLPQAQYVIAPGDEASNPGYGYFTSWVEQQIIDDKKELPSPYTGGYRIHTTLDEPLQNVAQNAVNAILPANQGLPEASVVVIDNRTGGVTAMVGGENYNNKQFNTATQAERQPGSAWKVFELAKALERGVSPNQVFPSKEWKYCGGPGPCFTIHNDEGGYVGQRTLTEALTYSDNSVFARVGLDYDGSTPRESLNNIADYAHDFGITTDVSRNPSMTIGGLYTGVTPLDMAHAYSTIARGGALASGSLASNDCAGGNPVSTEKGYVVSQTNWRTGTCPGPPGISEVTNAKGAVIARDNPSDHQVPGFSYSLDLEEQAMMRTVVTVGTGSAAFIPNFWIAGKTGTTSNYADAWFVGFTQALPGYPNGITVAVWVGYDHPRSMAKTYGGQPVYGGTYPAVIFRYFVDHAISITKQEAYDRSHHLSEAPLLVSTETAIAPVPTSQLPLYGVATGSPTSATSTAGGTTSTTPASTPTGASTPATGTNTPTAPTAPPTTGAGGGAAAP
ncbi:MAG TPA: transglycosylase domain-containing protein [Solirubrobacteraceae bacterium]|nr:transglycosylase domain-containing protein [Solirubrobacteraceae bacterium]